MYRGDQTFESKKQYFKNWLQGQMNNGKEPSSKELSQGYSKMLFIIYHFP